MRFFLAVAALVSVMAGTVNAQTWVGSGKSVTPRSELPRAARAAKSQFRPIAADDTERARWALIQSLARLDHYLNRWGKNGQTWERYLRLQELRTQLKGDQPDLQVLSDILDRFSGIERGLEIRQIAALGNALERYVDLAAAATNPNPQAEYERQLESLATFLEQYQQSPTAQVAAEIGDLLGRLEVTGRARQLVQSVRRQYSYPNLFVRLSEDVVSAGIGRPVDNCEPVRDVILGTYITGTARTIGTVRADLVFNPSRAAIDLVLNATAYSSTIGRNGPATIRSRGRTHLSARKRTLLDENGFSDLPATASATTNTTITGVGVQHGLFSGVVQRIASRRAQESKSQAERIAAQRAEARAARRLDAETAPETARANREYQEEFRQPLVNRDLFPQVLKYSSSDHYLYVRAKQADRYQLAAPTRPLDDWGSPDVGIRVHQSLLNNYAASLLAGETLTREETEELMVDLLGQVPKRMREERDAQPGSITFSRFRPITVEFGRGGFTVTIHGRRFEAEGRSLAAMNVTARYQAVRRGENVVFVRQGPLAIYPPNKSPDDRLTAAEQSRATTLNRQFERVFEPELGGEGVELPGRWKSIGKLFLTSVQSQSGWMSLHLNRPGPTRYRVVSSR